MDIPFNSQDWIDHIKIWSDVHNPKNNWQLSYLEKYWERQQRKSETMAIFSKSLPDLMSIRCVTYGTISIFISTFVMAIAFATSYWLESEQIPNQRFKRLGLWEACFFNLQDIHFRYDRVVTGCKWIFDEDFTFLMNFLEPRKYYTTAIRWIDLAELSSDYKQSTLVRLRNTERALSCQTIK